MTRDQLSKCMPHALYKSIDTFLSPINAAMFKYSINNYNRMAAFIAQITHESGSLRYVREIASGEDYEGRTDLGNVHPGDGKKYKGRGLIQITGRTNYKLAGIELKHDFIITPEDLETPEYASLSAAWFWSSHHLNELADLATEESFRQITRKINGGENGIKERLSNWHISKAALK